MREIFQPLLFLLARSSEAELRRQIEFLKAENEMLRTRVPKQRIFLKPDERARLLKLGLAMGPAIRHVITIVDYSTFRRWARKAISNPSPAKRGRPRISLVIRQLVVQIAKETGWGYSRILGELKKLRVGRISRQTVKNILVEHGLDPGPKRDRGTWSDFLRIHAETLWQCDCAPWKGGSFQRVQFPPGNWSLQPVAIGAAVAPADEGVVLNRQPVRDRSGRSGWRRGP